MNSVFLSTKLVCPGATSIREGADWKFSISQTPAVSAMRLVSEDGYVRAFNSGANLATINLTPRAVRENYPIYKRDRTIMDEERVLSAIAEAGCEPSRVGIAEHLRDQDCDAITQTSVSNQNTGGSR